MPEPLLPAIQTDTMIANLSDTVSTPATPNSDRGDSIVNPPPDWRHFGRRRS